MAIWRLTRLSEVPIVAKPHDRRRTIFIAPLTVIAMSVSAVPTSDSGGWERVKRCDAQAARVAAGSVWSGSSIDRGEDRPLRWVAHYSEKYDHCYVLIDHRIRVHNDSAPIVSELWDAFEAEVLADYTDDVRIRVRRSFCQVALSDDPFTSCAVSKYFIDEHMRH